MSTTKPRPSRIIARGTKEIKTNGPKLFNSIWLLEILLLPKIISYYRLWTGLLLQLEGIHGRGGQGLGLQGKRGPRRRPSRSQGVIGWAHRVQGGHGVGIQDHRGSRGRPTGSQVVKGYAYRVSGGQGAGLEGTMGSRGGPTGSQGVNG